MIGGAKVHYDGIVAFSQTDFTEELNHGTGARHARRRRSDSALCGFGTVVGEAPQERDVEDLKGLPARHANHAGSNDQR
jgi:hypothetical protein